MDNSEKKAVSLRVLKLLSHLEKYGIPTVASKLGVTPSKIYNWKYGSKPNFDALELISDEIPNIDWNEIMYGSSNGNLISAYIKESEVQKQLKTSQSENNLLKLQIAELNKEKQILYAVLERLTGAKSLE